MSILTRIEELQKAPVQKRKIILAVTVGICMVVIIGIWIIQLRYETGASSEGSSAQAASPFEMMFGSIKNTFNSIKDKASLNK